MKLIIKIALGIILALVLLVAGCGALAAASADEIEKEMATQTFSPSEGDGADDSPSEDGPTFQNGVLTTPDMKIEITRYKVIKAGQKGNEYGEKPVIAFWYKTTNLSGAKIDPTDFLFNFRAYQDNNPNAENELDPGIAFSDDRLSDSLTERIKKGGTVEYATAYELDDLDTPVDLVAKEFLGEVIGKATYTLR